jgi:hypothetical protein
LDPRTAAQLDLVVIIDITIINYAEAEAQPPPGSGFQILMSLVEDDLHGYEIMRRVEEQTAAARGSDPGTLYSSIQALLEAGSSPKSRLRTLTRPTTSGAAITASPPGPKGRARERPRRLADLLRLARARRS